MSQQATFNPPIEGEGQNGEKYLIYAVDGKDWLVTGAYSSDRPTWVPDWTVKKLITKETTTT